MLATDKGGQNKTLSTEFLSAEGLAFNLSLSEFVGG